MPCRDQDLRRDGFALSLGGLQKLPVTPVCGLIVPAAESVPGPEGLGQILREGREIQFRLCGIMVPVSLPGQSKKDVPPELLILKALLFRSGE